MCGRAVVIDPNGISEVIHGFTQRVDRPIKYPPRFNITPSQDVIAVRHVTGENEPAAALLRWGLVPSWAKDPSIGHRMANARAETVATKPAFRSALRARRCLVMFDGFYEWQTVPGSPKQPWFIHRRDRKPMAMAGLWERWHNASAGTELDSCTIITTTPNELMQPIHDRMPVILRPTDYAAWLNPGITDPEAVAPLLVPFPANMMAAYRVSTYVNSPRNDSPQCIAPLAAA